MFRKKYLKLLAHIGYKKRKKNIEETWRKTSQHYFFLKVWLVKTLIKDRFNLTELVFIPITIALGIGFYRAGKSDPNYTYYLISVTAIYSTIQLTFLLQKISFLRGQKESLMNESIHMWNALSNYRYLAYVMESHLKQIRHLEHRKALRLNISLMELMLVDMGSLEQVAPDHLLEFQKSNKNKEWLGFVTLVKMVDFIVNKQSSIFDLNTLNRVYAHNNSSINAYLNFLMNEGIFHLFQKVVADTPPSLDRKNYVEQISDKRPFQSLQSIVGSNSEENIPAFLLRLDRYIVNQVLLPLHDNTFIIEKKLPNAFLHLLCNAFAILFFGTIIPIINSFTFQLCEITRLCGGLTTGMLLMSIVLIYLTLFNEHNKDIFNYSKIVYQGKNDDK